MQHKKWFGKLCAAALLSAAAFGGARAAAFPEPARAAISAWTMWRAPSPTATP